MSANKATADRVIRDTARNISSLQSKALNACPWGAIITGPALENNPVLYANAGFRRLFALDAEKDHPDADNESGNPLLCDRQHRANKAMRDAFGSSTAQRLVVRSTATDGSRFMNEVYVEPFNFVAGTPQRYVAWCRPFSKSGKDTQTTVAAGTLQIDGAASASEALSGLANEAMFTAELNRLWESRKYNDDKLAVMVLALDDTNALQESFGDGAIAVAMNCLHENVLSSLRRARSFIATLEPTRLAVLLPGCSTEQAHYIALTICDRIRHDPLPLRDAAATNGAHSALSVTISAGVASAGGGKAAALVRRVESALAAARSEGDCVRIQAPNGDY